MDLADLDDLATDGLETRSDESRPASRRRRLAWILVAFVVVAVAAWLVMRAL